MISPSQIFTNSIVNEIRYRCLECNFTSKNPTTVSTCPKCGKSSFVTLSSNILNILQTFGEKISVRKISEAIDVKPKFVLEALEELQKNNLALRSANSNKWYTVIMEVPSKK